MDGVNVADRLSQSAIDAHWQSVSEALSRLLRLMDSREDWVAEPETEVLALLSQLLELLEDQQFAQRVLSPQKIGLLTQTLALLSTSRFMRVLEMADRRRPGLVSKLVMQMSSVGGTLAVEANLFYERLAVVMRGELLGQIFSAKRAERIRVDLEALSHEV